MPDKVTGAMKYGYDAMVPGMVHGKVLRPPSLGATLQSVDYSAAEKMPGVVGVFRDGDFVGLAAQHVEQAQAALSAIKATWKEPLSEYTSENIHQALKSTKDKGAVVKEVGNVAQALGAVTKPVNAVIKAPYISHGQIEPMTALVHVQPDKTEVWTSTQNPFGVQDSVAQVLNLPREQVIVYPLMSGGAFGRKAIADEVTVEAARLAKAFNMPVRVNWTRPEEFQFDHFRPAMLIEIRRRAERQERTRRRGSTISTRRPISQKVRRSRRRARRMPGASVLEFYTQIPDARTTFYQCVAPLPPYFWRANGGPVNALARETVIDELAELAGKDPVTFRAGLLNRQSASPRRLQAAVQKAGWQPGLGSTGKGFGVAVSFVDGTYVAEVAQVSVDTTTGKVPVKHIDVALDCGLVVNPAAVESQVEGPSSCRDEQHAERSDHLRQGQSDQRLIHTVRAAHLHRSAICRYCVDRRQDPTDARNRRARRRSDLSGDLERDLRRRRRANARSALHPREGTGRDPGEEVVRKCPAPFDGVGDCPHPGPSARHAGEG